MTTEEIDLLFPSTYGGNAQISDLRLALTRLVNDGNIGGTKFEVVATLTDRDNLQAEDGLICKVQDSNGAGTPETYIYDNSTWVTLHDVPPGGPGPGLTKTTESFSVSPTQATNQEIDLAIIPSNFDHLFVFLNGMYLTMGGAFDYTLSGHTLSFIGNILTSGDTLTVKYAY